MSEPPASLREVIDSAAAAFGIDADDAAMLHQHSNATVAFPSAGLVLRIAGSPDAFERVAGSVRVCRWLAGEGFPCTVPADMDAQVVGGHTVSAWHLEDLSNGPQATMTEFGMLLKDLHHMPLPPFPVRELADPFASVSTALDTAEGIRTDDRNWLHSRIADLRGPWEALAAAASRGLIHGDAHPGNAMRRTDGRLILADWDHTAIGPREWDLIQTVYTNRRFGSPDSAGLDEFAATYGRDIRDWPHAAVFTQIREITGLSPYIRAAATNERKRTELTRRITTLRTGIETAQWAQT